jgi:hypothetical protein
MATYIPGVKSYMPDFKPFTPDYKFLSNILDVKTNRYNTNYKAVNDLYSKVVYGDLSRGDTQEMRNQFAETLAPQLEKASGMDLSVMQNAEAARAIFKPFFEDDLIVKDLVQTRQYINERSKVNMIRNSSDASVREQYWDTGVRKMEYDMEDFVNASEQEALQMALPEYIPDADLFQRGKAYLEAQGYDVEIDYVDPANPDWVVTQQNGELITKQAMFDMQNALLDDPQVRNAYYADTYVRSRDFAKDAIESGQFADVKQAQAAWATETIGAFEQQLAAQNVMLAEKAANERSVLVSWDTYKQQQGVIPGSEEEQQMSDVEAAYIDSVNKLKRNRNVLGDNKGLDTQDVNSLLNRAYNIVMQTNMNKDLLAAATQYAATHKKVSLKENAVRSRDLGYAHDFEKQRRQYMYDSILQEEKQALKDGGKNAVAAAFDAAMGGGIEKTRSQITMGVEEGNLFESNQEFLQAMESTQLERGLDAALEIYAQFNPNDQNIYNIGKTGIRGTLQEVKKQLLEKPNTAAKFIKRMVDETSNGSGTAYLNADGLAIGPGKSVDPAFVESLTALNDANSEIERITVISDANDLSNAKNWEKFLKLGDKKAKPFIDIYKKGIPKHIKQDENGNAVEMSFEEYLPKLQAWASDIDLSQFKAIPDIMNDNNLKPITDVRFQGSGSMMGVGSPVMKAGSADFIRADKERRSTEAKDGNLFYDIWKGQTKAFREVNNGRMENPFTEDPIYEMFNVRMAMEGYSSDQMNVGDVYQTNIYKGSFDPMSPRGSDVGLTMALNMFKQYNSKGTEDTYAVDFYDSSKNNIKSLSGGSELSKEILDDVSSAVFRAIKNPKTKGKTPNLEIKYLPHANSKITGMDNGASYIVKINNEWMKEVMKGKDTKGKGSSSPHKIASSNIDGYNEIIFTFPKSSDINPMANSQIDNFSSVLYNIDRSENDQYRKIVPAGGDIRVYKNQRGDLIGSVTPYTWDSKDNKYIPAQTQSVNLTQRKAMSDQKVGQVSTGKWYDQWFSNAQTSLTQNAQNNASFLEMYKKTKQ